MNAPLTQRDARRAMQPAAWYFDFISPFAFLQWRRLRALGERLPIAPVPILFAVVLGHLGQKGPAEIPAKRIFTYRHVHWRAQQAGIPLKFPPGHPFNPLAALRLSIALDNRTEVIDAIFDHVWIDGLPGDSAAALAPLGARFGIDVAAAIADPEVKETLKRNTDAALAAGLFGVPTLALGADLYWGDDATEMALAVAEGRLDLDAGELGRIGKIPETARRI